MGISRISAMFAAVALVAVGCGGGGLSANAGADFSISVGESPAFDGCRSEGDIDNYQWTIVKAPSIMEGDAGKVIRDIELSCSFTLEAAMEVQEIGTWVVELTVSDAAGATSTDSVDIEVGP